MREMNIDILNDIHFKKTWASIQKTSFVSTFLVNPRTLCGKGKEDLYDANETYIKNSKNIINRGIMQNFSSLKKQFKITFAPNRENFSSRVKDELRAMTYDFKQYKKKKPDLSLALKKSYDSYETITERKKDIFQKITLQRSEMVELTEAIALIDSDICQLEKQSRKVKCMAKGNPDIEEVSKMDFDPLHGFKVAAVAVGHETRVKSDLKLKEVSSV